MENETMNDYDKFKASALYNFDCGFMLGEDEDERKEFKNADEVDAVIRKHFDEGSGLDSVKAAEDDLTDLFAQWMANDRKFA